MYSLKLRVNNTVGFLAPHPFSTGCTALKTPATLVRGGRREWVIPKYRSNGRVCDKIDGGGVSLANGRVDDGSDGGRGSKSKVHKCGDNRTQRLKIICNICYFK